MGKKMNSKQRRPQGQTSKIKLKKAVTPAKVQKALLAHNTPIFTKRDMQRLLHLSAKKIDRVISEAIADGILTRIKSGLYALEVRQPSTFVVANYLMEPSYISLETALSYYRMIPETVYAITSITPRYPKKFFRMNREFVYHKINKQLYFGYRKISIGGALVLIAEKEKAALDYLYFVTRGLRKLNQRSDFSKLNKQKLESYASIFKKNLKGRKQVAFTNLLEQILYTL